jgi:hypothetical protein
MNFPGFSAEDSLYKTSERHQMVPLSQASEAMGRGILAQLRNTDLPGATCGKAPVFGNVICVECTTGPFPTCKTYVCDKDGNNCKEAVRINTQALATSRTDIFKLAS